MSQRHSGRSRYRNARSYLTESALTGTAIVVPILLTVVVLSIGLDILAGLLRPIAIPIAQVIGESGRPGLVATGVATAVLAVLVLVTGALSESERAGLDVEGHVNAAMARIPGISSIHSTLNQVGEMLLEGDRDNFQEVVLVEFPTEGSYSVAFKTAEPPEVVRDAVDGDGMITVFMPMGPNPVMGGFVLHIGEERVHDVDLAVEEGISSIVSFGVAVDHDQAAAGYRQDAASATGKRG